MNKPYVVLAAGVFLVVAVTQISRSAQTAVEVVSKSDKIPRNFKTYSLFPKSSLDAGYKPRWYRLSLDEAQLKEHMVHHELALLNR
jgi:hypothetical protein